MKAMGRSTIRIMAAAAILATSLALSPVGGHIPLAHACSLQQNSSSGYGVTAIISVNSCTGTAQATATVDSGVHWYTLQVWLYPQGGGAAIDSNTAYGNGSGGNPQSVSTGVWHVSCGSGWYAEGRTNSTPGTITSPPVYNWC